jgi:hypothetical protein
MGVMYGVNPTWGAQTNEGRTHIATKGVVQSGLVLNLDAGVLSSYPGTGTTWTDLSGNGNNGTLTNMEVPGDYSTSNGGFLTFDGTNEFVNTNYSVNNLNDATISCWMRTSVTQKSGFFGFRTSASPGVGFDWVQFQFYITGDTNAGTTGNYLKYDEFSGTPPSQISRSLFIGTTSITTGNWINIVATSSSTKSVVYFNGSQVAENINATQPSRNVGATLKIGGAGDWTSTQPSQMLNDYYFNGNIAIGLVYNRALTPQEIQQNFNATKSRYFS